MMSKYLSELNSNLDLMAIKLLAILLCSITNRSKEKERKKSNTLTLKNALRKIWWAFDRTGYPFLFVKKRWVDTRTALTGSASHRWITASPGKSAVISKRTSSFLLESHSRRNVFHLKAYNFEHRWKILSKGGEQCSYLCV